MECNVMLDFVCGVVIFGILFFNISVFGLLKVVYFNFVWYGVIVFEDVWFWVIFDIVVQVKFFILFVLLFGVGL